jgi:hypothetical protein
MDRSDQKYGRRGPKRKLQGPLRLNTAVNGKSPRDSPYSSPTASNDERRSPHHFSHGPNSSPRHQVSSPLARVNEEIDALIPVRAGRDVIGDFATAAADTGNSAKPDKLVDAPTPVEVSTKKKEKLMDAPTPVTATDDRKNEFAGLARIATMPTPDEDKENHQQRYQSKVWALTDWTTT